MIIRGAIRNTCLLRKDSGDWVVGIKGQGGIARNTLEQEIRRREEAARREEVI